MKQILNKVTVTGADDTIEPSELVSIAQEFPFVEFGILLSKKQSGCSRFPSPAWLKKLKEATENLDLCLCGHICGQWVRDILNGSQVDLGTICPGLFDKFGRFQLNTHAEPHDVDLAKLNTLLEQFEVTGQSIIFQVDGVNQILDGLLPGDNVHALFDLSHGAGIKPEEWPQPVQNIYCGYAGGLSPINVTAELEKIEAACGGRATWIDAETHLRTYSSGCSNFDLGKVCQFLTASAPWVIRN